MKTALAAPSNSIPAGRAPAWAGLWVFLCLALVPVLLLGGLACAIPPSIERKT